jgi:hypothetical protein
MNQSDSHVCAYCGRHPAAQATFRWLVTVVIVAQSEYEKKWYCRDCGLAIYRNFCERTLVGGWWGVQGLCVPLVLLLNHVQFQHIRSLSLPAYQTASFSVDASGVAQVEKANAGRAAPLDPGKPMLQRWTTYIAPAVFAVLIVGFLIFRSIVLV